MNLNWFGNQQGTTCIYDDYGIWYDKTKANIILISSKQRWFSSKETRIVHDDLNIAYKFQSYGMLLREKYTYR